jgi:hypothetical protein
MHWVGVALLSGAGSVFLHWFTRRVDSLGRVRPFPWLGVSLLVVAGLGSLTPWFLRVRLEARLSDAASAIVGERVEVHCQSFGEAFVDAGAELGYVAFGPDGIPEKRTLIKREGCAALSDYLRSESSAPPRIQIVAVHTLTHEAMHMSGVTNEAETECLALQRDAEMARLLGADEAESSALAAEYWTTVYPEMPDAYRTSDCAPGGPLDRGGPDAPWP